MRNTFEYAPYLLLMLLAVALAVKPVIQSSWPLVAKVVFYTTAVVLSFSLIMFEYFSERTVAEIVRTNVGDTVCALYAFPACPAKFHETSAKRRNPETVGPTTTDQTKEKPRIKVESPITIPTPTDQQPREEFRPQTGPSIEQRTSYGSELSITTLVPFLALTAGILILLMPRLLNYIFAIYLIVLGIVSFGTSG